MQDSPAIYDSPHAKGLSLGELISIYRQSGVTRIIYKALSPNDNSKNQLYIGGHLTDLGFLPTENIVESQSTSNKTSDPKRQVKFAAGLKMSWLSVHRQNYPAPNAKLIYYPQYPEVRLSGFLQGCQIDIGSWMNPSKKGRSEGRVLVFGIKTNGEIIAWLATPESRIAGEISEHPAIQLSGVFNQLVLDNAVHSSNSKSMLIAELSRIHQKRWIESKRLNAKGVVSSYAARNGGGYTLEAELGVIPNGIAEPDFMGWEIKQFGVNKCHLVNSKPLTLMTPEPDGGFYGEQGIQAFIRRYGYRSASIADRLDFTGRHFANNVCQKSGLRLVINGFNSEIGAVTNAAGSIALLDDHDEVASSWSFAKILKHWKEKHARAVYVPSLSMTLPNGLKCYSYCNNVRLFEGAAFNKLLDAINRQYVYYDPGIKLENASTRPATKARSQFRIKSVHLENLYGSKEDVDVARKDGV